MKNSFLFSLSMCLSINLLAQKTEFHAAINSGIFSFTGDGANKITYLNPSPSDGQGNVANSFGSLSAISFGVSINAQKITKKNVILGVGGGYEQLRSKVIIDGWYSIGGLQEFHGYDFINLKFMYVQPYLGFRFKINQISIDLTGGVDIAYLLDARESAFTIDKSGIESPYLNTGSLSKPYSFDFRPDFQVALNYKKMRVFSNYAMSLTHAAHVYNSYYPSEIYSRLVRFGLAYQIM